MTDLDGGPVNVEYAGAAPGSWFGVFQLNVRLLPDPPRNGLEALQLQGNNVFGKTVISNVVQLYVR